MYLYGRHGFFRREAFPKNEMEGFRWIRMAAEQGNSVAEYMVGCLYHEGKGVPKDEKAASHWLRIAASRGNLKAQKHLATMYYLDKNYKQSIAWYHLAAAQGDARAQALLGKQYFQGEGVAKDEEAALRWLNLAAEKDDTLGMYYLGVMLTGLTFEPLLSDVRRVFWDQYEREYDENDNLVRVTVKDEEEPGYRDYKRGAEMIQTAAVRGNADAANALGILYHEGIGFEVNYDRSLMAFRDAVDGGSKVGERNLAYITFVTFGGRKR
jgi:TPR repeat protein